MRSVYVGVPLVAASAGLMYERNLSYWWMPVGLALGTLAIAHFARCRHPHPALQPALRDEHGQLQQAARWMCHDCGRSWAADFVKAQTPVVRYAGFDQTKAADAARRARELEVRQRELAMSRAGIVDAPSSPVLVRTRKAG
jgi:glutathione S-transferase